MPKDAGEGDDGIKSVTMTLRLIEHMVSRGEPVGVTDVAEALGTTKSRIFRHLRTLVREHYLTQSPETERYYIGPKLIALGHAVAPERDLLSAAEQPTRDLREAIGHSCVIGQVERDGVRIVMTMPGTSQIEIGVRSGSMLPFHSSAQGKVALAFGSQALRDEVLAGELHASTSKTIVDPLELREHLNLVRLRGWATAPDEMAIGLNTLALPIFNSSGIASATIAIVSLSQFIPARPDPELIDKMQFAADQISRALGYVHTASEGAAS